MRRLDQPTSWTRLLPVLPFLLTCLLPVGLMPAADAARTLTLVICTPDGPREQSVPVSGDGRVLNTLEKDSTWFYFASAIHGTLLIGDFGDRLLEIAAGLAIILIVTGLYLWWPRTGRSLSRALLPDLAARGRQFWKELHVSAGFYVSILMLLFLLSGLAWTGVWGEKYVQAWSSFPAEKWDNVPLSDLTHASMNHGALHDVPWGLEQTPMPRSIPAAATVDQLPSRPVTLESIGALAREIGFAGRFRINLPGDETGVYTISADSMDGDTADPTGDRTVHVDQYSGKCWPRSALPITAWRPRRWRSALRFTRPTWGSGTRS